MTYNDPKISPENNPVVITGTPLFFRLKPVRVLTVGYSPIPSTDITGTFVTQNLLVLNELLLFVPTPSSFTSKYFQAAEVLVPAAVGTRPSLIIIIDSVSVIVTSVIQRAQHSLEPMVSVMDRQLSTSPLHFMTIVNAFLMHFCACESTQRAHYNAARTSLSAEKRDVQKHKNIKKQSSLLPQETLFALKPQTRNPLASCFSNNLTSSFWRFCFSPCNNH